jgi:plasmid stabilization system protein ParE
MKLIFTSAALADLDDIHSFVSVNYPSVVPSLERRISAVLARIEQWPKSAREVDVRSGTRVVPLIRYPYKIFYRIVGDRIEILHIHHTARDDIVD